MRVIQILKGSIGFKLIFTAIHTTLTAIVLLNLIKSDYLENEYKGISIIFALVISAILLYLAIHDIGHFEIPALPAYLLLAFLIVVNSALYFLVDSENILLWDEKYFSPINNLLAGLIGTLVLGAIVAITKEQGMGFGDILLAAIAGLILGTFGLFISFYTMIFSASIIGTSMAIKVGKFKGLQLPLVPFITFSIILAFIYSHELREWYNSVMLS